jgi:hypothetical protein
LSVTLALIPVAIAVAGAMTTRKDGGQDPRSSFRFGTRMKDDGLLNAALKRYGCRSVVTDNTIDSTVGERRLRVALHRGYPSGARQSLPYRA